MDLQQLTIHPFPTASKHDTYLLEAEGRFFEIGKDTAELFEFLQKNGWNDDSIRRYSEVHNGKPSKEEISAFLEAFGKRFETDGNSRLMWRYATSMPSVG